MMTDREGKMYKGFFEDVEYVMGLFFKPFEDCCEKADDEDEDEEKRCGMSCDEVPCSRDDDDAEDGKACDWTPCAKDDDAEEEPEKDKEDEHPAGGGLLSDGPLQDIMKCMFDASDIDYDYED